MKNVEKKIDMMNHCIGFDPFNKRKRQKKYEAYRNFFYGQDNLMDELVDEGYAKKFPSTSNMGTYYVLNEKGLKFLSKIYCLDII